MANEDYTDIAGLTDWLGLYNSDVVVDPDRDAFAMGTVITAASRAIDNWTNRRFSYDDAPTTYILQPTGNTIFFPDLTSVDDAVITWDRDESRTFATTIPATDILFTKPHGDGPYRSITFNSNVVFGPTCAVKITGVFGHLSVPVEIEVACLMLAARYLKRRTSPEGVTGFSNEYGPIRISQRDADVATLISSYKRHGWA